jgi:hypothetical protein
VLNTPTVTPVPTSGQGCTPYHLAGQSTASTNSHNIKGAAGTLCRLTLLAPIGTVGWLKLYDSASAPTCSSATGIKHVYPVPATTTGAGVQVFDTFGETFANGIGYCFTGGGGDTDNTNGPSGVAIEGSFL